MNTTGMTSDRLGGRGAADLQPTERRIETASSNETAVANAGLSATNCPSATCEIFGPSWLSCY